MTAAPEILRAQRNAVEARGRFDTAVRDLQSRMRPANLASEAWDGVRDQGSRLADSAMDTVRSNPGAVSIAITALGLFLARDPLRRAASRFLDHEDQGEPEPHVSKRDASPRRIKSQAAKLKPAKRPKRSKE